MACALTGRSRATHYQRLIRSGGSAGSAARTLATAPAAALDDHRRGTSPGPGAVELRALPGSGDSAGLGTGARRGPLLVLGIEHVPHRPRRWAEPGTADSGQSPAPGPTRAGRPRPQRGVSWDITALKGPHKGHWYKLYVVLDIFSRYVPGWLVANAETRSWRKTFLLTRWPVTSLSRTRSMPTERLDDVEAGVRDDDRPRIARSHSRPRHRMTTPSPRRSSRR